MLGKSQDDEDHRGTEERDDETKGFAKRGGQSKNHMDGKTQEETHSQNTAGNDINGKESLLNGGFIWRIRIGKLPHYLFTANIYFITTKTIVWEG